MGRGEILGLDIVSWAGQEALDKMTSRAVTFFPVWEGEERGVGV
jgi:hypothetical protein